MLLFDLLMIYIETQKLRILKKKGCANILTLFTMVIAKQLVLTEEFAESLNFLKENKIVLSCFFCVNIISYLSF